ncbi:MAG: YqaE/Pmp3 family membrane protein [Candidatus Hydrogenedentes bacterium]|nr:YqaE/Pmp3 family membrane protein [Candidatus Hydrogenedentota bacterium]
MSFGRAVVCILLPPLAVIDKGCGPLLLVSILWLCGWIPGVIAALILCKENK